MDKLFQALFPEGKRKLIVTILALALGAGFEKYGGGLTDQMVTAILGLVGIFTGGNMVEHVVNIITGRKKKEETQPEPVVERDLDTEARVDLAISSFSGELGKLMGSIHHLQKQMETQAQNTAAIVNVINSMRANTNKTATPNVNPLAGQGREL